MSNSLDLYDADLYNDTMETYVCKEGRSCREC